MIPRELPPASRYCNCYDITREEINSLFYAVATKAFFLPHPRAVPLPSVFPATTNLPFRKRAPLSSTDFQEEETQVGDDDACVSLQQTSNGQIIMLGCDFANSCRDRNLFGANRVIIRLLCRGKFY